MLPRASEDRLLASLLVLVPASLPSESLLRPLPLTPLESLLPLAELLLPEADLSEAECRPLLSPERLELGLGDTGGDLDRPLHDTPRGGDLERGLEEEDDELWGSGDFERDFDVIVVVAVPADALIALAIAALRTAAALVAGTGDLDCATPDGDELEPRAAVSTARTAELFRC